MVHSEAARLSQPDRFLQRLNRRLREVISCEDRFEFITAFYLVIDTADGALSYATAGHHSQIKGPALMLLPETTFKTFEDQLNRGDCLLLFTDGLTEMPSRPGDDEELGIEGLIQVVNQCNHNDLAGFVGTVTSAVREAPGAKSFKDDVCVIGLSFQRAAD